MRIGIIGSGQVGGTLGKRWAQGGHTVAFSSRNPASDEMKKLVAKDLSGPDVGCTVSGGELVAEGAATATVVKAFNSVGFNVMANPEFGGLRALLFHLRR